MTIAAQLEQALRAVCPIDGVSLGNLADKSTWRIDFHASATSAQRRAAQDALTAFVPVAPVDFQQVAKQKIQDYLDGTMTARDAIASIKDAL